MRNSSVTSDMRLLSLMARRGSTIESREDPIFNFFPKRSRSHTPEVKGRSASRCTCIVPFNFNNAFVKKNCIIA